MVSADDFDSAAPRNLTKSIEEVKLLKSNLRIAVNAQILERAGSGGVETVLRQLAGLGQLEDGDEEYVFVGHWADGGDWLKPFLTGRLTIVRAPPPPPQNKQIVSESFRNSLGRLRPLARKLKHAFMPPPRETERTRTFVPSSNGFFESLNCDVVHFPYQDYVFCEQPTVYNPHDLQHLHFPQFFSADEFARRETVYRAGCGAAKYIAVASRFVKQDVAENYGIDADKIQVIRWAAPPVNAAAEKPAGENDDGALRTLRKYEIDHDQPFAIYPAMTWEHKNHIRLLEAIALLRDGENLKINLICTGDRNAFFPVIERRLRALKLDGQVKFTGVVSHEELSALYFRAQFVVIPTLFEAASAPLFEAWRHDVAVACSTVTSLPEQAAGAALLFNPLSVAEIADALKKMSSDELLRATLRAAGAARLQDFSRERTLKSYRALYRKAAGRKLNDEDRYLLVP